jgi:hypothetical protein
LIVTWSKKTFHHEKKVFLLVESGFKMSIFKGTIEAALTDQMVWAVKVEPTKFY